MKLPGYEEIAGILAHYAGPSIAPEDLRTLASTLQGQTGADIEKLVRAAKQMHAGQGTLFRFLICTS